MASEAEFFETLREGIRTLPAYNSGLSAEYVRQRYGVQRVAKLGSNENPWGASARVLEAVAAAIPQVALYPDPGSADLRSALAQKLNVEPGRLAFGNGSEDLISVCAHSFLSPGDEMLTISPSFGLHPIYAQAAGATVRSVPVTAEYRIDMKGLVAAIGMRTRMVMFSSPSNPVGCAISAGDMELLLAALPPETLLIFDEAYFEYAASDGSYADFLQILKQSSAVWILLRTFSKAYGLAGLRVGYGIASHASLIDVIDRARTPFNVNRLAQVAARAALDDKAHMNDCIERTVTERERLKAALTEAGYTAAPSVANFVFFDARQDASDLALRLLERGVIVKPWREPGFTNHVRVSAGLPEDNDQFLAALKATA